MKQNNVFEKIYTPDAQLPFLQQSDSIFRVYIKNKNLDKERFDIIFNLLDMTEK